jgi:hypothetical protein
MKRWVAPFALEVERCDCPHAGPIQMAVPIPINASPWPGKLQEQIEGSGSFACDSNRPVSAAYGEIDFGRIWHAK